MQKKPGQISSNTLGLRFMQNAAKAKQEKEVKAAKAKVRTEEEWELSPDVRQSWGVGDGEEDDQGRVTYEESYLPFLFPGFSSRTVPVASTSTHLEASEDEDEGVTDPQRVSFKGRRTFGKHGEEVEKPSPEPDQPLPSNSSASSLPRGARSISSRGRSAISSSGSSNGPKPRPPQQPVPPPPRNPSKPNIGPVSGAGFMKPQVDAPREESGGRKKRPSSEAGGDGDAERKTKKRKEKEAFNFAPLEL